MAEQHPIDEPHSSTSINAFQLITIGFLLGTSLSIFEWIAYRIIQDLFILMEIAPLVLLLLTNLLTTAFYLIIVFRMYYSIQKKLKTGILDWKKLLSQSKYLFSIIILLNLFVQVYWDLLLPASFFNYLEEFNFVASSETIYFVLPNIFTIVSVILTIVLLKRLSDRLERLQN
ncbi:MAG: hypothetical protein AB8B56_04330 [Crocinitomicaceae bacterium]